MSNSSGTKPHFRSRAMLYGEFQIAVLMIVIGAHVFDIGMYINKIYV